MKKLMILGAGIYQFPLIEKAKELGYYTVVCSIKGNYPGFNIADKVYYVNTTDREACLDIAINEQIDAVCTTGTDVALPTLGYIVDTLHLKGPSEQSAIVSSNKLLMKEAFVRYGVKTAAFQKVTNYEECQNAADLIGYPCVLKVVDSSGSRGIEIVHNSSTIEDAYDRVKEFTKLDYIIVEEFLDGDEFGAQAFVYDGDLLFVMPHTDEVFEGNTGVPVGHTVPYSDISDENFENNVKNEIKKSINALGIDNTAINVDFMLVNGVPYVLEIGARCGATCLAELTSIYYGIDYYNMIIQSSFGCLNINEYNVQNANCCATALLIYSNKSGVFHGNHLYLEHPNLISYNIDIKNGDYVNRFAIGPDRLGSIIVKATNISASKEIAKQIQKEARKYIEDHTERR